MSASEWSAFCLVQLFLSSIGFLLDLMVLNKSKPYAFVGSFLINAGLILAYSWIKHGSL